jgi:hypothetical protein
MNTAAAMLSCADTRFAPQLSQGRAPRANKNTPTGSAGVDIPGTNEQKKGYGRRT